MRNTDALGWDGEESWSVSGPARTALVSFAAFLLPVSGLLGSPDRVDRLLHQARNNVSGTRR